MRVLVIGATGFIGKNLVKELVRKNYEVICLVRKSSKKKGINFLRNLNVELYYSKTNLIKEIDVIYHVVGLLGGFNIPNEEYWKVNYFFTKSILKLCRNQKFIYISSSGVLGPIEEGNEISSYNPTSTYEKTKVEAEKLVKKYKNHIIIRPGLVFGPYDLHLLQLFRYVKKSLFFIIGNGKNLIQPLFVDDLVDVLIKCMNLKIKNETFLVAGEKISFKEFYRKIAKGIDVPVNNIKIPVQAICPLVFLFEHVSRLIKLKPILTMGRIKLLTQTRTYDIKKIKTYFNFRPTPLEQALKKTITFYKKEGCL